MIATRTESLLLQSYGKVCHPCPTDRRIGALGALAAHQMNQLHTTAEKFSNTIKLGLWSPCSNFRECRTSSTACIMTVRQQSSIKMCLSTSFNFLHVAYADPPFYLTLTRLDSVKTPGLLDLNAWGKGPTLYYYWQPRESPVLHRHRRYIVNNRCFLVPKSLYSVVKRSDHGHRPQ